MNVITIEEALMNGSLEERNMAMVYAHIDLKWQYSKISEYTSLAVSTIKNYVLYKYANLLNKARKFFDKISKSVKEKINTVINKNEYPIGHCSYIIEYIKEDGNYAFLKIGKTKNINNRIPQHIREYGKTYGQLIPNVKQIYYFEDEDDSLVMESSLRKFYKAKEDCGYIKQDRFSNLYYNEKELKENEKLNAQLNLLSLQEIYY